MKCYKNGGNYYQVFNNELVLITWCIRYDDLIDCYPYVIYSSLFDPSWVSGRDILYMYHPYYQQYLYFCRNELDQSYISVLDSLS
jgi:hypothetical protein